LIVTDETGKELSALAKAMKAMAADVKEIRAMLKAGQPEQLSMENQLRRAADWWHDEPRLAETKVIRELMEEGFDFYDDILPMVRAYAGQATERYTWNFFASVIRGHEQQRLASRYQMSEERRKELASYVYVPAGSLAREAWDLYCRRTTGLYAPSDDRGGWYFPSEFPEMPMMG
jgi:hypothetical protein